MKKLQFMTMAVAAMSLVFTACDKKSNDDVDSSNVTIKITPEETTVKVNETVQLRVVVSPEDAVVKWTVDDDKIASVDQNGLVTGLKADLPALITATATKGDKTEKATAIVNVIDDIAPNIGALTKDDVVGSEIYPIALGKTVCDYEPVANRIKKSFTIDDVNIWHDWWNDGQSLEGIETDGQNGFYSTPDGWFAAKALWGSYGGWSWDIYNTATETIQNLNELVAAINADIDNYYLHIALKSTDNASVAFSVLNESVKFNIGAEEVEEGAYMAGNYKRDGKWAEFNIPLATFKTTLAGYSDVPTDGSKGAMVFAAWTGGSVENGAMNIDAVFIYKK